MAFLGTVRGSFWIILLISTNILTGLFVSLNSYSSSGNLCKVLSDVENYDDTNPLYHNFDIDRIKRKKRSRDLELNGGITEPEKVVQRNKEHYEHLQKQLKLQLKQLGLLVNYTSSVSTIHANCSIPSKINNCEVGYMNTVFNLNSDGTTTTCSNLYNTDLTIVDKCANRNPTSEDVPENNYATVTRNDEIPKSIFAITPTYARYTQKVDLVSLCQTVMHVPNFIWIVIEDAPHKTQLVTNLLERCKVNSVHLNIRTPPSYRPRPGADKYQTVYSRGVKQRNLGLSWIREYCLKVNNCTGSVYFMDDDNKYDLRLFDEIKKTIRVSVFPVGFSGGLKYEGPNCNEKYKATSWHAEWDAERPFPIDMAGFAVQVQLLLSKPDVWVGFDETGQPTKPGYLETMFLENFASRETVECRSNNEEVLVWHVKTQKPWILFEARNPSDERYEI